MAAHALPLPRAENGAVAHLSHPTPRILLEQILWRPLEASAQAETHRCHRQDGRKSDLKPLPPHDDEVAADDDARKQPSNGASNMSSMT
mmetsp:Transcript_71572/g.140541  ORF Transcript_71572/g.140541 Transcript_71572/m.140541 type:complete len:89 (-) Transcript_71572:640-906(-)